MNKHIMYENSLMDISDIDKDSIVDFINIGVQIKNELGLISNPIEFLSSDKLRIGNIIGNIALNNTNIIILPKFLDALDYEIESNIIIKKLFARTIKCAAGSLGSTVYFSKNAVVDNQSLFFDVLAKYYFDILSKALKKFNISLYEECTEKVKTIKGHVLIQKQLSQPIVDEKTWCRFKRMTNNNIFNQLLYWACKYICELTSNFELKRKMLALSMEFPQTTDLLNRQAVNSLRVPRQFFEYEECIELAKGLYLDNYGKKERLGSGKHISGYIINMERSFENIVCFYSKHASISLGYAHKSQAVMKLASSKINNDLDFYVKPDDLISSKGRHLIVDAKYKALSLLGNDNKRKPSRDDFYQMVSSCIAYNSSEAVLIYPITNNFPQDTWDTINNVNGYPITVRSAAIDLMQEDGSLVDAFVRIIKETDFYKEKSYGAIYASLVSSS